MAKDECLFCEFTKGGRKLWSVYENKYVFAFLDINPAGKLRGHTLVLPKKHFETIDECDDAYLKELILAIKRLIPAIRAVSGAEGINVLQNNGKAAGQLVKHVHFHIIPRMHKDGIRFDENRRQPKPMELAETAESIREELKNQK